MQQHYHVIKNKNDISGLAITSLLLSCLSIVIGPFGFVPGIVCGHLALRNIQKTSATSGKGIALAGLSVGYLFLLLSIFIMSFSMCRTFQ